MDWQPIATAPKDGSPFATYSRCINGEKHYCYGIARWVGEWDIFSKYDCGFEFITHWAPLTEPSENNSINQILKDNLPAGHPFKD
jgi:hypothetical protein